MSDAAEPMSSFLRVRDVLRITGLARSTLYRMMAEECFPAPCRLGARAVGWRRDDIVHWSQSRPTARGHVPAVSSGQAP